MRVAVSVFSRFHAFSLAHQLQKRGYLRQLITSYPKFEVRKYDIPDRLVTSLLSHELMSRAWHRIPKSLKPDVNLQPWLHERFDRAAAARVETDVDLYVGWSSFSERALLRLERFPVRTVLERGSAHIECQRDILMEEYEQHGLKAELPHPAIVDKELREYAMADFVSVPSRFVQRTFLQKGFSPDRILVTPYGVDTRQFQRIPGNDGVFRVVYAGNMSLQKGVHYLVQAFHELKLPDAELWLIGSLKPEIEPFFSRYQGSFRYIGHVPQAELNRYYSQCSAFAICSIQEGMATVQPQAMACGLPLICTTNTGGEDLITEGIEGFVVPTRDVAALKDRILRLYQDRDRCAEMGRAAEAKASAGLSWDDYGRSIIAQYERILGLGAGSAGSQLPEPVVA